MKYVAFENQRMQINKINPGHVDFAVGVLRGVTHFKGKQVIVTEDLAANIEAVIDHVRAAARLVDRVQHQRRSRKRRR